MSLKEKGWIGDKETKSHPTARSPVSNKSQVPISGVFFPNFIYTLYLYLFFCISKFISVFLIFHISIFWFLYTFIFLFLYISIYFHI